MLQSQSILRVCENSGAKKVKCIKVLGGFKRTYAKIGDLIVVSVRYVKQHKKKKIKIKEGDVTFALVVRVKKKHRRFNNTFYTCQENAVVLLTAQKKPYATRILGSLPRELRYTKYMKVASLSSGFI